MLSTIIERKRSVRMAGAAFLAAPILGALTLAVPGPASSQAQAAGSAQALRVCADPDNLPFSSTGPGTPGIYIELGQDLARSLDRSFEPVWSISNFGKHSVRTTLLAGKCDAYMGLPDSKEFMGSRLVFSKPFLRVGYVIALPASLPVTRLDDLRGKRVAVQFGTPPQILLASHDDIEPVTFLNPEEAMQALAAHEVDAAFVWGPTAGYINQTRLNSGYRLVPVQGQGMQWLVSIGFAQNQVALRDRIDQAIEGASGKIGALQVKYGFPSAEPVTLTSETSAMPATSPETPRRAPASTTSSHQQDVQQAQAAPEASHEAQTSAGGASATEIAAGREAFNVTCSHCHGPDAVQSERKINLRLLHRRYGDRMDSVFHTTVINGRPDKGMPSWKDVVSEEDVNKILAYLHSVQTN